MPKSLLLIRDSIIKNVYRVIHVLYYDFDMKKIAIINNEYKANTH